MREKNQSAHNRFRRWLPFTAIALLLLLASFHSFSQTVSATVNRDKILIGEQIEVQLKVDNIDPSKFLVDKWFDVPDSFNHFEVVKRFPIDTVPVAGNITYQQKIIITSFDSGSWYIPAFPISFTSKNVKATDSILISVLPVDVSGLKDYHDIKDIIKVEPKTDWLMIGLIAGGVIILVIIIILLVRYFKKRKTFVKSKPKQFGIAEALAQIDALQKEGLIEKGKHKLFFTKLIDICRSFSDVQLNIVTTDKTTDEYMIQLKGKIGTEPAQVKYFQLLRLADAVKFAKFIPSGAEPDEAIVTGKSFLQTIYQYQFQKKDNAG